MATDGPWLIPLDEAVGLAPEQLGGKAVGLATLRGSGYRVPDGFCVTVSSYQRFLSEAELTRVIEMELGRTRE